MKVRIRNAVVNVKYAEHEVELNEKVPLKENFPLIKDKLNLKQDDKSLRYTLVRNGEKINLPDYSSSLNQLNFKGDDCLLVDANNPLTIKGEYSLAIAYSGPIIVFTLFLLNRGFNNLQFIHIVAYLLNLIHYSKRIYESLYVHDYGINGFLVLGNENLGASFYYWVLYGVSLGYNIFTTEFDEKACKCTALALSALMLLSEYGNYYSHMTLRNTKIQHGGKRGILRGGMFEYVSCAHYFYELLSWTIFAFIVRVPTAYLFILYSFLSMTYLAYGKHKGYQEFFGEQYPKNRKAIIPFIL